MPQARKNQICLSTTPYYHCISRCVRKAFLCGKVKNNNYEHRRKWLENRLFLLQSIFAIDICSYAIMSNHYHVVIRVNIKAAESWSDQEVLERWHQLCKPKAFIEDKSIDLIAKDPLTAQAYQSHITMLRTRLSDISWFMRMTNENIARRANREDDCTGRFWEGRFKSQALLDEKSLLACMIYNDLNPIRAGEAKTPETSNFTSIKKRIENIKFMSDKRNHSTNNLFHFSDSKIINEDSLPFKFCEYLNLLDWTGRQICGEKGTIEKTIPPILNRLDISHCQWILASNEFPYRFKRLAGTVSQIKKMAKHFGYKINPPIKDNPFNRQFCNLIPG